MKSEKIADDFRGTRKKVIKEINLSKASILISVNPNSTPQVRSILICKDDVESQEYMFSLMYGMADLMAQILSGLGELDGEDSLTR